MFGEKGGAGAPLSICREMNGGRSSRTALSVFCVEHLKGLWNDDFGGGPAPFPLLTLKIGWL
ncbi:MAG: hypothetical protein PHV34_18830 [Verrucomicrobiae bacterium]|nr:hypothetical protein [Verrucomicrobiae bacterium]